MEFSIEHIHESINRLGRLMPAKPNKSLSRKFSLKETIFMMAPKLLEMRQMGFTTAELVSALEVENIAVKGPTLNRYLCDYQKIQERDAGAKASQPAAVNDTADDAVAALEAPLMIERPSAKSAFPVKPESAKSVDCDSRAIRA